MLEHEEPIAEDAETGVALEASYEDDAMLEEEDDTESEELRRLALIGLLGANPLVDDEAPDEGAWVEFAEALWMRHEGQSADRVHRALYLRRFRKGEQWLSSQGRGAWREPARPKNTVRAVVNVCGPALDYRLQVITENRPGVRVNPATLDQDDQRRAHAAQAAWDYQYEQQRFAKVLREACYYAQTDGVSFIESYWDPDRGPLGPDGSPLGDIKPCVHRIENVRVSANATATEDPHYVVIRRVVPLADAIARFGDAVAKEGTGGTWIGLHETPTRGSNRYLGLPSDGANPMFDEQETVDEYTVYVRRIAPYLPEGLMFKVIGNKLVFGPRPLYTKDIPVVRVPDGSPDPSYFCRPLIEDWVDDQMRLNAVFSKWVENVRRNAGGRMLAKAQSIVSDTLSGDQDVVIEVRTPGALNDAVQPLQGFSIGRDAERLIEAMKIRLEELHGWNDTARGTLARETSGRAVLAIREQLERVFAPSVYATAEAVQRYVPITLDLIRWGYDVPRAIGMTGKLRPDQGRMLVGDDLDGEMNITLDAETMMPMPRSLRMYVLDDQLQRGLITPEEYRDRSQFAITKDSRTPNRQQEAAAMRTVEAIRMGQPVPDIEWVHNEAMFQDVIERELLLADPIQVPPEMRQLAREVWKAYADQAAMKMGGMPAPGPALGEPGPEGLSLPPSEAPTLALPSPIAVDPLLRNATTEGQAADLFERTAAQ